MFEAMDKIGDMIDDPDWFTILIFIHIDHFIVEKL